MSAPTIEQWNKALARTFAADSAHRVGDGDGYHVISITKGNRVVGAARVSDGSISTQYSNAARMIATNFLWRELECVVNP